jgi:hypothetical protein
MQLEMKTRQVKKAFEKSTKSNAIKATRRIFFNHLDETIATRGYFHVDQMYGAGSGILIKKTNKFYLLTAHHVLESNTKYDFQNPSPFWISSASNYQVESIHDFLMPAWVIHIGECLAGRGHSIDASDLVLIELFHPSPKHLPNHFIDLDYGESPILKESEFFEGQLLLVSGFPFIKNSFSYLENSSSEFTHSTTVHRNTMDGVCRISNGEPYINLDGITDKTYPNLSGISGGIVTDEAIAEV